MSRSLVPVPRFPSGVPGLDNVLQGGLPRNATILVEGQPGSGKTTVALQFLLQAVRNGETCLLATNAETPEQLRAIALSHGWSLDGIHVSDLGEPSPTEEHGEYTLFPEAEVEVDETLRNLFEEVERLKPTLLVLDTISSLRILAPTPAFHRRQLKRIRDHMASVHCTTIMLDEASMTEKDLRSQTLADGIIELKQVDSNYGADRRRLRVRKLRGCRYLSGAHDFTLATGGVTVYPRLVAQSYEPAELGPEMQSGITAIDALTGGGLPRGSCTLIVGPAGIGKSTISTLYAMEAAKRGEKSSILLFDESIETHVARGEGLGLDISAAREAGLVRLNHLDLVVPDGQPVRWALNALHHSELPDRVYGPTLMLRVCERAARDGQPVFLYGSRPAVVETLAGRLAERFPTLSIAGRQPSRFRSLSAEEKRALTATIRASGARITFVGLGCPRQEVWAYEYRDGLHMPVLAVGAAFDFHAGVLPQAPVAMQRLGLEWLYRFLREPRRLWRRYLLLNPSYLALLALQASGLKRFDLADTTAPEHEIGYG